jgi:hypothetical protein
MHVDFANFILVSVDNQVSRNNSIFGIDDQFIIVDAAGLVGIP